LEGISYILRRRANRTNAEIAKIKAALQKLNEKSSASGPIHARLVETSMETNTEKRESTASLAKALELKESELLSHRNFFGILGLSCAILGIGVFVRDILSIF